MYSHGVQSVFHPTDEFLFWSFSQVNNGSKYLSSGFTSIVFTPTILSNAEVQGSDFPRCSIWLHEKRGGWVQSLLRDSRCISTYMYNLYFLLFGLTKFAPGK